MRKSLGRLSYDNYMPIRPLGKTIPHRCNNQGDACTSTQYNTHRPTTGHSCHMFYNRINNNDLLINPQRACAESYSESVSLSVTRLTEAAAAVLAPETSINIKYTTINSL